MVLASGFRDRLARYLGQKFVLTAGSLSAVFTLAFTGKDVRQLEIIVPAVLAFYYGANVAQKQVLKTQGEQSDGSVDNGGNAS